MMKNKMRLKNSLAPLDHAVILTAALALTSSHLVFAESAPEHGVIAYKHLDYQDKQGNLVDSYTGSSSAKSPDRIHVRANAISVMMPIAGEWSISAGSVHDAISGASPGYHSKRVTKLTESREAYNLGITRYLPYGSISVGLNKSDEHDYHSKGFSLLGSWHTETKNTTLNFGMAVSNDEIELHEEGPEKKHVTDWLLGVTQVLSVNDIGQLNLGYSKGFGYFSDPYKSGDRRPDWKEKATVMGKWNHFVEKTGGSTHLSYRYYIDTFDVKAHTIEAEYTQPFMESWTVTPLLRLYSQSSAYFYSGIDPSLPEFDPYREKKYLSLDQRLGTFGAITWGLKLTKEINQNWQVDLKYENYTQKESWALSGDDKGANEPFYFRSIQFGISRKF